MTLFSICERGMLEPFDCWGDGAVSKRFAVERKTETVIIINRENEAWSLQLKGNLALWEKRSDS